ncbi:MAG: glucose-6-phosphate dehydrogenase, partial [Rickettsiales bacterium]
MATTMLAPADIVIFGGTGDLSLRKILPALYHRHNEEQLNPEGRIFCLGRHKLSDKEFQATIAQECETHIGAKEFDAKIWKDFSAHIHYIQIDANDSNSYDALAKTLGEKPRKIRVFYLATPASIFGPICQHLKAKKLVTKHTRVVLEKPLGYDLKSFCNINDQVLECLDEGQIYRIDHYLGKETVQN